MIKPHRITSGHRKCNILSANRLNRLGPQPREWLGAGRQIKAVIEPAAAAGRSPGNLAVVPK